MKLIPPMLVGVIFSFFVSCGNEAKPKKKDIVKASFELADLEGDWVSLKDESYRFRITNSQILYPFSGANPLALDGNKLTEITDLGDDPEESKMDIVYQVERVSGDSLVWYEQGRMQTFKTDVEGNSKGYFDPDLHAFLIFRERSSFQLMADVDFRQMLKNDLGENYNAIIGNMGGGHGDVTVEDERYLTVSSFVNRATEVFETMIVLDLSTRKIFAATTNGKGKLGKLIPDNTDELPPPLKSFIDPFQ